MAKEPKVIKKNGNVEAFDFDKIVNAVGKSADRVQVTLTEDKVNDLKKAVKNIVNKQDMNISVKTMHNIVECALDDIGEDRIAASYREYRNYKVEAIEMQNRIFQAGKDIKYLADKNNANTDSTLISTQRVLLLRKLAGEIHEKTELSQDERNDIREGWYYIHDRDDRFFTMNCCLFDFGNVLKGGFEMANMAYTEPKSLKVAMSVTSDIALSAASQQYGGFTLPEIDKVLEPYAVKSFNAYLKEFDEVAKIFHNEMTDMDKWFEERNKYANKKLYKEMLQGFQEWEYKFNTLSSSRGDYPKLGCLEVSDLFNSRRMTMRT